MPDDLIPNDGAPVAEVTLEGRHVRLEPLSARHAEGLLAAANQPGEEFPFTWVPRTAEQVAAYIGEARAGAQSGQMLPFATVARAGGEVLGSTRFWQFEFWKWAGGPRRPAGNPDAVEIGWTWLSRRGQRTPANSEAKLLMLGHAFETWKVCRVTLKTDHRNQRSRDAIARIGAQFEGIIRAQQPASDGGIRDSAWFSMLAREWPAAKAKLLGRLARDR